MRRRSGISLLTRPVFCRRVMSAWSSDALLMRRIGGRWAGPRGRGVKSNSPLPAAWSARWGSMATAAVEEKSRQAGTTATRRPGPNQGHSPRLPIVYAEGRHGSHDPACGHTVGTIADRSRVGAGAGRTPMVPRPA